MLIHLMQHGACMPKEIDAHQPLSPIGREQITKSAMAAQKLGLRFELVIASPKVRSLQTAEIMAEHTGYPVSRIEVTEDVKAMANPRATLDFISQYQGLDSVFIAGHLPSISMVASTLLTGGTALELAVENGGLIQIDWDIEKDSGILNFHLSPSHLNQIGS